MLHTDLHESVSVCTLYVPCVQIVKAWGEGFQVGIVPAAICRVDGRSGHMD